ncbi:hypothetical protein JTB14_000068 [Gonioctena quinquepunctata]|nr:hypothetical protein JTB14_000068 [Gonioctena quinquepunctata]
MASYVNQIVETGQKSRGTGFKIDDEWIGSLLLADYLTYSSLGDTDNLEGDPTTVQDALSRPGKENWRQAVIQDELHSLEVNEAWELIVEE